MKDVLKPALAILNAVDHANFHAQCVISHKPNPLTLGPIHFRRKTKGARTRLLPTTENLAQSSGFGATAQDLFVRPPVYRNLPKLNATR
jgi:hypothetical protein